MLFLKEFYGYLLSSKKYWLIPVFLIFALIGLLLVASQGSVIAPFIYTLF